MREAKDSVRTAMHQQALYRGKEELNYDGLEHEPEATSSSGGMYTEVHSHSKI